MRKSLFSFAIGLLVLTFALPALGASTSTSTSGTTTAALTPTGRLPLHWFAGSVSSVGSNSLTLGVLWTGPHDGSLNGQTLTLSVPTQSRISQGPRRTPIALAAIQPNELVSVLAAGGSPSSLSAAVIHVNCDCHWIGGTISSIGSSSFTVQVSRTGPYDTVLSGQNVTIQTGTDTVYLRGSRRARIGFSDLKVGEGTGVIFAANGFFKAPGFDASTATFTAARVHIWGAKQVPSFSTDADAAAQTSVG